MWVTLGTAQFIGTKNIISCWNTHCALSTFITDACHASRNTTYDSIKWPDHIQQDHTHDTQTATWRHTTPIITSILCRFAGYTRRFEGTCFLDDHLSNLSSSRCLDFFPSNVNRQKVYATFQGMNILVKSNYSCRKLFATADEITPSAVVSSSHMIASL